MNLNEIINKILFSQSKLKQKDILELIEKKKSEACNFLTNEAAARLVASELGIKIEQNRFNLNIQIKDLISGLNDVSILGKVVAIYPPKTFIRKNGKQGKLASIIISDKSGTLRVVFWDDKVDFIENKKIYKEQKIRIYHGYVREGQNGNLELHLGQKGKIQILT